MERTLYVERTLYKAGGVMFKAVLVMILAVMSSNAMAEWVAVGILEDNTI